MHPDPKELLRSQSPTFWEEVVRASRETEDFVELFRLSTLRKKAQAKGLIPPVAPSTALRIALLGGYSLYPLSELIEHLLAIRAIPCEIFSGDFDNYVAEITDPASKFHAFKPHVVFLQPSERACRCSGSLLDSPEQQKAEAAGFARQLLELSRLVHDRTRAELLLANFVLPGRYDLGAYRSRTMGSDWNFRKQVNLELGLNAPSYVQICDVEFLACRRGALQTQDEKAWFETKQAGSPAFLVDVSREIAHLVGQLRSPPKKVLVLDLDNTLWGGLVGEDGMTGIEIGDTSPRGEAFKAFQNYLLTLRDRGVLLAVCSKNDHAKAVEPFEQHPEMVLRMKDIISFKANWEPKSDNLRQIAAELNVGLDSFVFVDDSPGEIEIVRQFTPEVSVILLGTDPSQYVRHLKDSRLFEPRTLTPEDTIRTAQYQSDHQRRALQTSVTDMDAYLASLEMEASLSEFSDLDVPRLAQLINKSNQFNLTTRRRSEAEVAALIGDPAYACFSVRLRDRFGDHGLISIIICEIKSEILEIDTWLMSCRVLNRQVEETVVNEFMRIAQARGCSKIRGVYLPTLKNEMVRDLYSRMGLSLASDKLHQRVFESEVAAFRPFATRIRLQEKTFVAREAGKTFSSAPPVLLGE